MTVINFQRPTLIVTSDILADAVRQKQKQNRVKFHQKHFSDPVLFVSLLIERTTVMFKFKLKRKRIDEQTNSDVWILKNLSHRGFPAGPTSIAYDSELKLIAIGTKNGEIRMFVWLNDRFFHADLFFF